MKIYLFGFTTYIYVVLLIFVQLKQSCQLMEEGSSGVTFREWLHPLSLEDHNPTGSICLQSWHIWLEIFLLESCLLFTTRYQMQQTNKFVQMQQIFKFVAFDIWLKQRKLHTSHLRKRLWELQRTQSNFYELLPRSWWIGQHFISWPPFTVTTSPPANWRWPRTNEMNSESSLRLFATSHLAHPAKPRRHKGSKKRPWSWKGPLWSPQMMPPAYMCVWLWQKQWSRNNNWS